MIGKTLESLRADMLSAYLSKLPQLDLTEGTPERDLFIEAPIAGSLYYLHQSLDYLYKLHAPFIYYSELSEVDIDEFCKNFGIEPQGPTKSFGLVTFFTYTEPTEDITIPQGTIVSTSGSEPIEFQTVSSATLYSANKPFYFNASKNRWEIIVPVESIGAGPEYRAGSNTVTLLVSSITGIDGVTNVDPIAGGSVGETTEEKLQRVLEKFQGRNLGTVAGLTSFVKQFTKKCMIITSGDPLMLRDGGFGGCVDIYVLGEELNSYTESIPITALGLIDPINTKYTSTSITLEKQPVMSIISCLVDNIPLPLTYYTLQKDTGLLKNSTKSKDKLVLTPEGINFLGSFQSGQVITISYTYNELFHKITNMLVSDEFFYINRDYLVRGFTKVVINVSIAIAMKKGYSLDNYLPSIQLVISDVIDRNSLSSSIERADIVTALGSESYIDNISLESCVLTSSGGGTITANGDILLTKSEYAVCGSINVSEWI